MRLHTARDRHCDTLTRIYTAWLARTGHPAWSADELLCSLLGTDADPAHVEWLRRFCAVWERAERLDDHASTCPDCGQPSRWVESRRRWEHVTTAPADCFNLYNGSVANPGLRSPVDDENDTPDEVEPVLTMRHHQ